MASHDQHPGGVVVASPTSSMDGGRPASIITADSVESAHSTGGTSILSLKAKKLKTKIKRKLHVGHEGEHHEGDEYEDDDDDDGDEEDTHHHHHHHHYDEGVTPSVHDHRTAAQVYAQSHAVAGPHGEVAAGAHTVAGTRTVDANGNVHPDSVSALAQNPDGSVNAVGPSARTRAGSVPASPAGNGRPASVRSSAGSISIPATQSDWKRRAEFQKLFEGKIEEDEHLVSDYTCAWAKDILRHGRLYVGARHMAFSCTIIGLKCSFVLPFADIVRIEKAFTARVIPNAISVTTQQGDNYFLPSFVYRDTSYDLIVDCWKAVNSPAYDAFIASQSADVQTSIDTGAEESPFPTETAAPVTEHTAHAATTCSGDHFKETVLDVRFPSEPEKIFNLVYRDDAFMQKLCEAQKLTEYKAKPWVAGSKPGMEKREYQYTKPLGGSVGPSSAVCYISDEELAKDAEKAFEVQTVTKTPDVPSGGSFEIQTKTCLTWAGGAKGGVRMVVTTKCVWSGRSMIKGIVTSASIAGQREYNKQLAKSVRRHIAAHPSEFGSDDINAPEADDELGTDAPVSDDAAASDGSDAKMLENSTQGLGPLGPLVSTVGRTLRSRDLAITILALSNVVLLFVLLFGELRGGSTVKVTKTLLSPEKEVDALQRLQSMEMAWGEFRKCVDALSTAAAETNALART